MRQRLMAHRHEYSQGVAFGEFCFDGVVNVLNVVWIDVLRGHRH